MGSKQEFPETEKSGSHKQWLLVPHRRLYTEPLKVEALRKR